MVVYVFIYGTYLLDYSAIVRIRNITCKTSHFLLSTSENTDFPLQDRMLLKNWDPVVKHITPILYILITTFALSLSLSHSLFFSLSLSHTHAHTHIHFCLKSQICDKKEHMIVHMHTHAHTQTYTLTHTHHYSHTHTHAYPHTWTQTCIHTHTHTHRFFPQFDDIFLKGSIVGTMKR